MNNEVTGTAQNSAGTGDGPVLKAAEMIHFDEAALAKGSDAAIQQLIAEFRGLAQADPNLTKIKLRVRPRDDLSNADAEAQVDARIESLRKGLEAAGLASGEFRLVAAV
ncbi:hypothetical protein [Ideonella sp. A 288]|uniref:hypothetical protein n=1 Tax=Ideonella sp. A 288 TaxID=1962181 RepID=UPI000B4A94DF|nr:hypothetical protein [Ideonella sp. A 288]